MPVWQVIHGLNVEIDPNEWTHSDLLRDGFLEPLTCELIGKLLKPGDTYVDVGAQIGFHSMVARRHVGPSGKVVAFEPQPYNGQKFLNNCRLNGFENVTLYMAAVGNKEGTVRLRLQSAADTSRLSLCLTPINDEAQAYYTLMTKLETVLRAEKVKRVKLLKIDVEGYELEVVKGLAEFESHVENVVLELLGSAHELDEKAYKLIGHLQTSGFELRTVEGQPWTRNQPLPENNLWAKRVVVELAC
jgi:FkbM family methyltransferase